MLKIEQSMMGHSKILSEQLRHGTNEISCQKGLINHTLSDEQQDVYKHLVSSGDLKCVVGYAGTGKSYLLGAAREAWEAQGYSVKGATLADIAAENLEASSGMKVGRWQAVCITGIKANNY